MAIHASSTPGTRYAIDTPNDIPTIRTAAEVMSPSAGVGQVIGFIRGTALRRSRGDTIAAALARRGRDGA